MDRVRAPRRAPNDEGTAGFRHRSALKLMTMCNGKTPKGEAAGYLSAILYLMPHTSGGGVTLCPHSTEACRAMCLAGSGLSGLPKALGAKQKRTTALMTDPVAFGLALVEDIHRLVILADAEEMRPVVRLNGTSDILWERDFRGLFGAYPEVQFMDYTKVPLEHRKPPANYHLTFSHAAAEDAGRSVAYLADGRSVAAVVDEAQKAALLEVAYLGRFRYVDGDEHDLRFLDPSGSIVLLKPKGHVVTSLLRPALHDELTEALYG